MALCLVFLAGATVEAAMVALSWIPWLGWGLVGTCAYTAGSKPVLTRP